MSQKERRLERYADEEDKRLLSVHQTPGALLHCSEMAWLPPNTLEETSASERKEHDKLLRKRAVDREGERRYKAVQTFKSTDKPKKPFKSAPLASHLLYQAEMLKYKSYKIQIDHPEDAKVIRRCARQIIQKSQNKKTIDLDGITKSISNVSGVLNKHRSTFKDVVTNILACVCSGIVLYGLASFGVALFNRYSSKGTGKWQTPWFNSSSSMRAARVEKTAQQAVAA